MSDQLEKLDKKYDLLMRENEKLINEQKPSRSSNNSAHTNTSKNIAVKKYKPCLVDEIQSNFWIIIVIGLTKEYVFPPQ